MEQKPDFFLLIIFFIFLFLGILVLASVSAPISQKKFGDSFYYFRHQIIFGVIPGLILCLIFYKIDLNSLKKYSPALLIISLILTAMVFIPNIGLTIKGGTRWIKVGSLSFQPSEFLKIFFIIYLAAWLESQSKKKETKNFYQTFFAFFVIFCSWFWSGCFF